MSGGESPEHERSAEMNRYKVKYTVTTHSRCGSYVYGDIEKVEANSESEAVDKVRSEIKETNGQWKFRLIGVKEITQ